MSNARSRVLVLDHDPDFLLQLEHLLEDEGFRTTITWNTWEALALLSREKFDAVVVGDHAPEVNCVTVLQWLRRICKDVPCLVLKSAPRFPFYSQYLGSLGAWAVIPRSKTADILEKLRQSLRSHPTPAPSERVTMAVAG